MQSKVSSIFSLGVALFASIRRVQNQFWSSSHKMRGDLNLSRDTARHRVYSARYEDLCK